MEIVDTCRLPLLRYPQHVRPLTNTQSDQLKRLYPDIPSLANCITCRGKNNCTFVWWADPDHTVSGVYSCPCDQQYLLHRWFLWSGIGETYQRLSWEDFYPDAEKQAYDISADYIDNIDAYVSHGAGMILHGSRGVGKTMLAILILKALVVEGHDCYATTFDAMLDGYTAGWDDKEARRWFNARVTNAGVLFIDDVGRERKARVSIAGSMLESVVRQRVARSKPIILTTNESPDTIGGKYGGHLIGLLSEKSVIHEMVGPNRRDDVRERLLVEIHAGMTRPIVVGS